jgi:hypothetical protein
MIARLSEISLTGRVGRRCLRHRFDFAAMTDRVRMPWRFLARRMAVDGDRFVR